jgi:tripartite-type tricarboxylate transporter receptor subunit TctC
MRRSFLKALGAACFVAWATQGLAAEDYPARPVRVVIPFTPGGGSDSLGRLVAQKLSESFKQQFIVENKPGAGGSIGTREVASAAPDGYTLLIGTSSTHGINPWIYPNLGYDALKDFAQVSMLATTEYSLSVPASLPVKSVAELIKLGQSTPTNYASSGNGTTSHLAAALFASYSKAPFVHVPYKSSAPGLTDLLGGQVAFMFDNVSVHLPHAQSGKLRILATSGTQRTRVTPTVPTLIESGIAGYEMVGWFCVLAPAGTPPTILDKLNRAISKLLAEPEVAGKLRMVGNEPFAASPDETRAYIAKQLAQYRKVVEAAGAKVE